MGILGGWRGRRVPLPGWCGGSREMRGPHGPRRLSLEGTPVQSTPAGVVIARRVRTTSALTAAGAVRDKRSRNLERIQRVHEAALRAAAFDGL